MAERTCIFCGGKESKENLLRWVSAGGLLCPDWTQKLEGRSVYTHFDKRCLEGIYSLKKLSAAFNEKYTDFAVKKEEIVNFVSAQAKKSFDYYFALCRKSGVLLKGQNLIAEEIGKGTVFYAVVFASDVSEKTADSIERKAKMKGLHSTLSKEKIGAEFDGREVSVFALKPSKQSEKLIFYMNLLNNFTSGDI